MYKLYKYYETSEEYCTALVIPVSLQSHSRKTTRVFIGEIKFFYCTDRIELLDFQRQETLEDAIGNAGKLDPVSRESSSRKNISLSTAVSRKYHNCFKTADRSLLITSLGSWLFVTAVPDTIMLAPAFAHASIVVKPTPPSTSRSSSGKFFRMNSTWLSERGQWN